MPLQQVWATPRHVALRRNFGKATALMIGIGACAGDVVITIDADLQDDPDEIPRFLETLGQALRPSLGRLPVGVPWDDAVISALAPHAVVLSNALVLGAIATPTGLGRKPRTTHG